MTNLLRPDPTPKGKSALVGSVTFVSTRNSYCNSLLYGVTATGASDSRRLERIQERALRAIYCDKHSSYGQLLSMAGLSTVHNRRLQDIAILMYKVKNNMCPTYISTLFEQPAIKYELRNHDFTIPRFNTVSFGKHSLRYMGPRVWSSVPSNVKKASTLSSFKYNIRKVDLSMLLADNNCSNCSLCTS